MKVKKYITKEVDIDIQGITLLSVEEYKACRQHIQPYGYAWWLRSPGYHSIFAAFVMFDGRVNCYGDYTDAELCVRPVLKVSGLTVEDKFTLFNHNLTAISDEYALCDDNIGRTCFREDFDAEDANDYEMSDIKKFVENWLEEKKHQFKYGQDEGL